jgi:hypothetical protein
MTANELVAPYVGRELSEKLANPLVFQSPTLGVSMPQVAINGYDVTILIDICKAVLQAQADGKLRKQQAKLHVRMPI